MKAWVRRTLLPRTVGPKRILAGPLQGCTIVTSWHDYPAAITGRTELPLLNWFNAHVKSGETWLDIGGHYGYTALALAKITGPTGRVYTFEPVLPSAGCISETRRLNEVDHISVVPLGLGSPQTLERLTLPLTRGMVDATLNESSGGRIEEILIARFDWLWQTLGSTDPNVDGIKIDVQGMELAVLTGMHHTLRTEQPKIVLEVHHGVEREAILKTLFDLGYGEPQPIDDDSPSGVMADNCSYAFFPR